MTVMLKMYIRTLTVMLKMYIRNIKTSPKIRKQRVIANNTTMKMKWNLLKVQVQFSSVTQSCLTPCDAMDCSMPGFPVHQQLQLPELTQTYVHCVSDATQQSHPLLFSSPPTFNLFQHQGLFQ